MRVAYVGTMTTMRSTMLVLMVSGCAAEEDWSKFGRFAEVVIDVGVEETTVPAEAVVVGEVAEDQVIATVEAFPSGGPVGTVHALSVQVEEDFESTIQRVEVRVDAGKYGMDSFTLRQDPAFVGEWGLDLESLGVPGGKVRKDTFRITLWTLEDTSDE
jgi:hypothetical protein